VVEHLREAFAVSKRRACRALGQSRSSQRYTPQVSQAQCQLTERIINLTTDYGRYGYRRIAAQLQWDGWQVNHKRVERIWRRGGLKVAPETAQTGRAMAE
jgi:hypothetical protein